MAMSVAQEEKDPWRLAIALESLVHKKIQKKKMHKQIRMQKIKIKIKKMLLMQILRK